MLAKGLVVDNKALDLVGQAGQAVVVDEAAEADKEEAVVPLAVTKMEKLLQVLDLEDQTVQTVLLEVLVGLEVEAKMEELEGTEMMETMEQLL